MRNPESCLLLLKEVILYVFMQRKVATAACLVIPKEIRLVPLCFEIKNELCFYWHYWEDFTKWGSTFFFFFFSREVIWTVRILTNFPWKCFHHTITEQRHSLFIWRSSVKSVLWCKSVLCLWKPWRFLSLIGICLCLRDMFEHVLPSGLYLF